MSAKINDQISAREVRLIDELGEQRGITSIDDARAYAYSHDLDLVEVAAQAEPPVCRVLDYGKWRYAEERKAKESRRNRVEVTFKEVRLRPKIGSHDYAWKKDRLVDFLQRRSKVKLVVLLRGRERERPDVGRALLQRMADDVKEFGHVEGAPVFEGRSMSMVITPNAPRS